ncbi:hypothetical protein [Adhaeribacter rhizoryzae]|uniref:Uncharacterized protein n=1 Tax=Adhaeribacter rhizoryzae TaxID=2607907 RepID=A0A5M6DLZ8_9BACT|nr:hypothetical protein [Adhaeribacter rhizoryzae]KAA5548567.1 hypothetical protein F0145_03350 [Adhaeribacter rhizoryzae]
MEIASLVVILIVAVCIILTMFFLLGYLIKRNKAGLRNAAISFAIAALSIGILISVEEIFFSFNRANKEELLVASREAPIGGILLKLYTDSTFEIGGFREVTSTGVYKLKSDTLLSIIPNKEQKQVEGFTQTTFIIRGNYLEEVPNKGINFLEIHLNKLK